MTHRLDIEPDLDVLSSVVRAGIRANDPNGIGHRDWQTIGLALRGTNGDIVGGIYGATMWSWLMIDGLWVDASLRGCGYGKQLLAASEEIAISRNCIGAWLGTFDFQARAFYEKQGYSVFATLPEFPVGHTHYHLFKRFQC